MDIEQLAGLEPESKEVEHTVYELFKWSIILKGVISVAEVVVGITLLILPVQGLISFVQRVSTLLSAHAGSVVTEHIAAELGQFGEGAALFVALYLLTRGLVKCALIWGLLRNAMWAYPASLVVLGAFVCYQLYQIIFVHSFIVVAITAFDIVVMYLIWREWRIVSRHHGTRPA